MAQISRRMLLAFVSSLMVVALSTAAVAVVPSPQRAGLIMRDRVGDANGVNDQSEGLIGNAAVGHDVAEADLEALRVSRLRSRGGDTVGFRFVITMTGVPGHIDASGTPLRYAVVMQLTKNCRMSVEYVARGTRSDGQAELSSSCDDAGLFSEKTPLRSRVAGHRVLIDVPYSTGPAAMQPGEMVEYTGMLSSAAISAHSGSAISTTQIDNAATYNRWMLPQ